MGLSGIDSSVRNPDERGAMHVEGPPEALIALERHLGRRARAIGRPVVSAGGLATADAWREIARKLGIDGGLDPRGAAKQIVERAGRSIVLVRDVSPSDWGAAVARAVGEEVDAGRCLVIVLTPHAHGTPAGAMFEIGHALSPSDVRLWCEAAIADPREPAPPATSLFEIEAWWAAARALSGASHAALSRLDAAEKRLLDRIELSGRSWLERDAARLDVEGALSRLLDRGVLAIDEMGCVVAGPLYPAQFEPTHDDAVTVAEALEALAGEDPWSLARASELHAASGNLARAEEAMERALAAAADASIRDELWRRYEGLLGAANPLEVIERRLRAVDWALRYGDIDRALHLARAASDAEGDTFAATWALGRAARARGDATMAAVALDKARELAPDDATRTRIDIERAETCYLAGEFDDARLLAEQGLRSATDPSTRLAARNVIGKLALARGAWSDAERHFAVDAHDAASAGDRTAELRARLNRGIALLMAGRNEESHATLRAVAEDGERWDEHQAVVRGLHHLAIAAHRRHAYDEALRGYGEALGPAQRLGDKLVLTDLTLGLVELKVALNLLSDAEQTLAFGRKVCGPWMPATLVASFESTAAHVHLAHRRTEEAARTIRAALRSSASSPAGDRAGLCHLLATRIALEEGDRALAEQSLARARESAITPRLAAEAALLEAMLARASGEPCKTKGRVALELARQVENLELELEGHLLLARAHVDASDDVLARGHVASATRIRDHMARGLPEDVRACFFQRPDLIELARLDTLTRADGDAPVRPTLRAHPPREAADRPGRRIVGNDPAIVALRAAIRRVGAASGTVLIRGESGTGKELVAEAIHEASARSRGPLVKVNCAALVETLLLSELFGHDKGAFTGATAPRKGRFELAAGGTLFLDEIGDISPHTQTALLRVLQEGTFERVGGTSTRTSDCRVICATHRDLKALVDRGEFREDLYYRLQGLSLYVPPLRERLGDLPSIAQEILHRIAAERGEAPKRIAPRTLAGLARHAWPGNIRELDNALRAATLFGEGDALELHDFTRHVEGLRWLGEGAPARVEDIALPREPRIEEAPTGAPVSATYAYVRAGVSLGDVKQELERECIAMALVESSGNITRAAALLGMKRSRLSQLVKQYGLKATMVDSEDDA